MCSLSKVAHAARLNRWVEEIKAEVKEENKRYELIVCFNEPSKMYLFSFLNVSCGCFLSIFPVKLDCLVSHCKFMSVYEI